MVTTLAREELRRAAVGRPTALTIGVFDGVHRGHQALLRRVREAAAADGLVPGVVTFHPHPRHVVDPDAPRRLHYLTSLEDRLVLLREAGMRCVAPVTFTSDLATADADHFVSALVEELQMAVLVVGPDFALGRHRAGDLAALRTLSARLGFRLEVIVLVEEDDAKVSSSEIRAALSEGDMARVNALLGRRFALHGPVVAGHRRGATLGFPTANVAVAPDRALPATGVYAAVARLPEGPRAAVVNVGVRPTFDDGTEVTVECHILDWQGDLYGQDLRLELAARLRPERRFSGLEELARQIAQDCADARKALTK